MPKNVPKYLRNSRDQAICIAICLSLISFCSSNCLSSWAQNKKQSVLTHLLNLNRELTVWVFSGFLCFNCFDFFFISLRHWLTSFWTVIPICHFGSEIVLIDILNIDIEFLLPEFMVACDPKVLSKLLACVQLFLLHIRKDQNL